MTRARSRKAHEVRKQRRASTRKRNLKHGYKPSLPRSCRGPQSWKQQQSVGQATPRIVDTRGLTEIVKRLTAVV